MSYCKQRQARQPRRWYHDHTGRIVLYEVNHKRQPFPGLPPYSPVRLPGLVRPWKRGCLKHREVGQSPEGKWTGPGPIHVHRLDQVGYEPWPGQQDAMRHLEPHYPEAEYLADLFSGPEGWAEVRDHPWFRKRRETFRWLLVGHLLGTRVGFSTTVDEHRLDFDPPEVWISLRDVKRRWMKSRAARTGDSNVIALSGFWQLLERELDHPYADIDWLHRAKLAEEIAKDPLTFS